MTAISELFVDETVRDAVEPIVRAQGIVPASVSVGVAVPPEWQDIWDASLFPDVGRAAVFIRQEVKERPPGGDYYVGSGGKMWVRKTIGTVSWATKFSIEDQGYGKYIEAEPSRVEFAADGRESASPMRVFPRCSR